jgi:hypothetical protein
VYSIPEFKKPAGDWCHHCDTSKGCTTYNDRPARCVEFQCLWLASQSHGAAALPVNLRPDKCKVVFAPSTNERVMTATTLPGHPMAWHDERIRWLVRRLNQTGVAVAIGAPAAETNILIKQDGRAYTVHLTPPDENGMQWSKST